MLFTKYLHIVHTLQPMKRTFSKLFLCMCKDPNLAEKLINFAKAKKKKVEFHGVCGVRLL